MAFVLAFGKQPLGLGSQGNRLSQSGAPVVVHTLGVLGHTHNAVLLALVIDHQLLAVDRNHGNVLPNPCGFFQNLHAG